MANNNQNQKVIYVYSEGSSPSKIILEILKKNGLEETLEEKLKKIKEVNTRGVSRFIIIDKIAKEIADEKISSDKASIYLQERLKIPKETAEKLLADIKTELVQLTEKIIEKEATDDEEENMPAIPDNYEVLTKNRKPGEILIKNVLTEIQPQLSKKDYTTNELEKPRKSLEEKKIKKFEKPVIKQPLKKADNYRELIE